MVPRCAVTALVLAVTAAAQAPLTLQVCCNCGDDAGASSNPSLAFNSISAALQFIRSARNGAGNTAVTTVELTGVCTESLTLGPLDSNMVFRTASGAAAPATISGGLPVWNSSFTPVTDHGILAQMQPLARPFVVQLDLHAMAGVNVGTPQCRPYMGGEASILPGNLVSSMLELFFVGDPTVGGDFSPLTLARYPNSQATPMEWTESIAVDNYTMTVSLDNATAARAPLWAAQLVNDPGSVYAHYINDLGWADHHNAVTSVQTLAPSCAHSNGASECGSTAPAACGPPDVGFDYDGNDLQPPALAGSYNACCSLCANLTGCQYFSWCISPSDCNGVDCYLKSSDAGRDPNPLRTSGKAPSSTVSVNVTLAPCPSHYAEPGFDTVVVKGHFYVYNVLAELDQPGEYYLNRTSGVLYVWPPSPVSPVWRTSPWGSPVMASERPPLPIEHAALARLTGGGSDGHVDGQLRHSRTSAAELDRPGLSNDTIVAYVSVNDSLVVLNGANSLTFEGIVFEFAQGAAIIANNATNITFSDCLIQNVGNMALNVTNGTGVFLVRSVVRHAGNGAVYLYAGDRTTLQSSHHLVLNSTLSYSNRFMFCYVPLVALAHCGNQLVNSELYGGPHQGIFAEGNNHLIQDCLLHDLVQGASDSGALYAGRDWTYQGTHIVGNTFMRIESTSGPDVSAVYLDDQVSGFVITGNTFINVSRALLLGGGRDNVFADNTICGCTGNDAAVHFDNRGMNWQSGSCSGEGELVQFLSRVPYNTSQVWMDSYPHLVHYLTDDACVPKYNAIVGTVYGQLNGVPFLDVSNASIASWDSTAWNNTAGC